VCHHIARTHSHPPQPLPKRRACHGKAKALIALEVSREYGNSLGLSLTEHAQGLGIHPYAETRKKSKRYPGMIPQIRVASLPPSYPKYFAV